VELPAYYLEVFEESCGPEESYAHYDPHVAKLLHEYQRKDGTDFLEVSPKKGGR
jgi:hypothetical protein